MKFDIYYITSVWDHSASRRATHCTQSICKGMLLLPVWDQTSEQACNRMSPLFVTDSWNLYAFCCWVLTPSGSEKLLPTRLVVRKFDLLLHLAPRCLPGPSRLWTDLPLVYSGCVQSETEKRECCHGKTSKKEYCKKLLLSWGVRELGGRRGVGVANSVTLYVHIGFPSLFCL